MNTGEKLKLLLDRGLLPMTNHQAYGTLLRKHNVEYESINKKTGLKSLVEKKQYIEFPGPVIKHIKDNQFPEIIVYSHK